MYAGGRNKVWADGSALRYGTCGAALVGVVQPLAERSECLGLPMLAC